MTKTTTMFYNMRNFLQWLLNKKKQIRCIDLISINLIIQLSLNFSKIISTILTKKILLLRLNVGKKI